jgi:hypothetical protein
MPRAVLQAPLEASDGEARQCPRQASEGRETRQQDLGHYGTEGAKPPIALARTAQTRGEGTSKSASTATRVLDIGVVCPGTQHCVDQGCDTSPGLETGGRVNKAGRH